MCTFWTLCSRLWTEFILESRWKRVLWVLENPGILSLQVLESPGKQYYTVCTNPDVVTCQHVSYSKLFCVLCSIPVLCYIVCMGCDVAMWQPVIKRIYDDMMMMICSSVLSALSLSHTSGYGTNMFHSLSVSLSSVSMLIIENWYKYVHEFDINMLIEIIT